VRQPKNAMEIFQVLDQSNCRECGKKTCLAFAGAVFTGQKMLTECPRLDADTIKQFSRVVEAPVTIERDGEQALKDLINQVANADLEAAAKRVGAPFSKNKLTLKILGKDVSIDTKGNIFTDIHINPWVVVPFLSYILHGKGLAISGNWVSFRELNSGKERYPLFQKRCGHLQRTPGGRTIRIGHIRGFASPAQSAHYDVLLAAGRWDGIECECLL